MFVYDERIVIEKQIHVFGKKKKNSFDRIVFARAVVLNWHSRFPVLRGYFLGFPRTEKKNFENRYCNVYIMAVRPRDTSSGTFEIIIYYVRITLYYIIVCGIIIRLCYKIHMHAPRRCCGFSVVFGDVSALARVIVTHSKPVCLSYRHYIIMFSPDGGRYPRARVGGASSKSSIKFNNRNWRCFGGNLGILCFCFSSYQTDNFSELPIF